MTQNRHVQKKGRQDFRVSNTKCLFVWFRSHDSLDQDVSVMQYVMIMLTSKKIEYLS